MLQWTHSSSYYLPRYLSSARPLDRVIQYFRVRDFLDSRIWMLVKCIPPVFISVTPPFPSPYPPPNHCDRTHSISIASYKNIELRTLFRIILYSEFWIQSTKTLFVNRLLSSVVEIITDINDFSLADIFSEVFKIVLGTYSNIRINHWYLLLLELF